MHYKYSPNTSRSPVPCVLDCAFTKELVPKLLSASCSTEAVPGAFMMFAKDIPCNTFVHTRMHSWPFHVKNSVLWLSFAFAVFVHTITSVGGQDPYLGVKI